MNRPTATTCSSILALLASGFWLVEGLPAGSGDAIPADQARRIQEAAPAQARVAPRKPRRVLIWNTPAHLMADDPHKGYCIPYGTAAFEALGRKTGAFEPVVSDDLAMFLPETLGQFAGIVLNNSSGPWITPTASDLARPPFQRHGTNAVAVEAVLQHSLLTGVARDGLGIVAIHYALGGNRHWPEFGALLGGRFLSHPWNEEIGVTVEDPASPLVAAFGGKGFRLADEIFEYGEPYDRGRLRVLLSLDPARSNLGVKWIHREDGDFALAWVQEVGQGRVFCTSFGHRTELFWNPQLLQFYLDAIQFAAGDLDAPTAPGQARPAQTLPGAERVPGLPGFVSLFSGQDLAGWTGDAAVWSVRDSAIAAETPATGLAESRFLVWKDEVEDFELRLRFRLERGDAGICFRARKREPGEAQGRTLAGPQAGISSDHLRTGGLFESGKGEAVAERGQKTILTAEGGKQTGSVLGDPARLLDLVKSGEWNSYTVVARRGQIALRINGVPMAELDDRNPQRAVRGWLGLEVGPASAGRVQFKDIVLRRF